MANRQLFSGTRITASFSPSQRDNQCSHIQSRTWTITSTSLAIRSILPTADDHQVTGSKHPSPHYLVRLSPSPRNRLRWPFSSKNQIQHLIPPTNSRPPAKACATVPSLSFATPCHCTLFTTLSIRNINSHYYNSSYWRTLLLFFQP